MLKNKADVAVVDPGYSDHHIVILNLGRKKSNKKRVRIKKTQFTDEVLDYARFRMPQLQEYDTIEHMACKITTWLLEVNERATIMKYRTVSDPPLHNEWYSDKLRHMKQKVITSVGTERKKLRNKYVSAIRKAKKAYWSRKIDENTRKGGVWNILNKKPERRIGI